MIADRAVEYEVESTVTGQKIEMGIAQHALAHIMSVLTNLYSDRQMAVIREYSTNAYDAHVEAGIARPIEVTLPSPLSPFLRIKDFGVGMGAEDIVRIYSQYGESTKRRTNDQVGMLGLGCKSALTYSAQFSVVSVKDHIRTTVSVSRDETGAASMTIVETLSTTEPNGTEVVIPAKSSNDFEAKAMKLFAYWEPGRVLVNGRQPEPIAGLEISKDVIRVVKAADKKVPVSIKRILLVKGDGESKIVMGGVPYPTSFYNIGVRGHSIVAFVDIGEIDFAPSREALIDTSRTKTTIRAIEAEFSEGRDTALQRSIDAAGTLRDALRLAAGWREALGGGKVDFSFNGRDIPHVFDCPVVTDDEGNVVVRQPWIVSSVASRTLSEHSRVPRLPAATAMDAMWVHGYTATKFTATHKKRLDKYAALNDMKPRHYVLHEKKFVNEWIDDSQIVDWQDIRQVALERSITSRPARLKGSYDVYLAGLFTTQVPAADIKTEDGVFFLNTTYLGNPTLTDFVKALTKSHPGCTVALLPTNRVAKFQRDFPMAIEGEEEIRNLYQRVVRSIRKADLIALKLKREHLAHEIRKLDPSRIDDPRVAGAIRLAKRDVTKVERKLLPFGRLKDRLRVPERTVEWKNPLNDYPLYGRVSDQYGLDLADIYTYINAVFAARKES